MSSLFIVALYTPMLTMASGKPFTANETTDQTGEKALQSAANRSCGAPLTREYVARHRGIGFEVLDSESEACFVPDQEYRLLDDLIDSVLTRTTYDGTITTLDGQGQQAAK